MGKSMTSCWKVCGRCLKASASVRLFARIHLFRRFALHTSSAGAGGSHRVAPSKSGPATAARLLKSVFCSCNSCLASARAASQGAEESVLAACAEEAPPAALRERLTEAASALSCCSRLPGLFFAEASLAHAAKKPWKCASMGFVQQCKSLKPDLRRPPGEGSVLGM